MSQHQSTVCCLTAGKFWAQYSSAVLSAALRSQHASLSPGVTVAQLEPTGYSCRAHHYGAQQHVRRLARTHFSQQAAIGSGISAFLQCLLPSSQSQQG
jgi:hypothetical protein